MFGFGVDTHVGICAYDCFAYRSLYICFFAHTSPIVLPLGLGCIISIEMINGLMSHETLISQAGSSKILRSPDSWAFFDL